jgi:hypothetical protein
MLAWKLTLVPALIAVISLVGQRFGHALAGLLAGLPVVAGPIFLFMTVEQGEAFGVGVALNTLVGLVPYVAFAVSYAWMCQRWAWPVSLAISWVAYLAMAMLLSLITVPLSVAVGVGLLLPLGAHYLFPAVTGIEHRRPLPKSEIPLRMLAGAVLLVAITEAARYLGPQLSGLLTPFPILSSVLTVFSHRLNGASATIAVLRGLMLGLFGFVVFFSTEAALLPVRGVVMSTVLAALGAMAMQGLVYLVVRNRLHQAETSRRWQE